MIASPKKHIISILITETLIVAVANQQTNWFADLIIMVIKTLSRTTTTRI